MTQWRLWEYSTIHRCISHHSRMKTAVGVSRNSFPFIAAERSSFLAVVVFSMQLGTGIEYVTKDGVLGRIKAYVYTVEFQKHGLGHANKSHYLKRWSISIHLRWNFGTLTRPKLREVWWTMSHWLCSVMSLSNPCVEDGECSKKCPKGCSKTGLQRWTGFFSIIA